MTCRGAGGEIVARSTVARKLSTQTGPPLPFVPHGFSPAPRESEARFNIPLSRSAGEKVRAERESEGADRTSDRPSDMYEASRPDPLCRSFLTASPPLRGREKSSSTSLSPAPRVRETGLRIHDSLFWWAL